YVRVNAVHPALLRFATSLPPFPVSARQPSVSWDLSRRWPATWHGLRIDTGLSLTGFFSGPIRPMSGRPRLVEGRCRRSRRREVPARYAWSESEANFLTAM